ncbi:MAG TPA: VOC family protein [Capsulimonadaceae bacterium]|nr:VOC family protein [Capsulimonadaceae bacterium]
MSHSSQIVGATPIFHVPNGQKAADYYVNILGFTLAWGMDDPVTFCKMERGNITIFLFQTPEEASNTYRAKLSEKFADLYLFVSDVDAIYTEVKGRGANCLAEPKDYDYGMRDFNVRDLNGYILTFGQEVSH